MKKHILSAVAILVIGLGISSCSDYLSVERFFKDRQSEEKIFKSKNFTEQWLAKCYNCLLETNLEITRIGYSTTNFADDMIFNESDGAVTYNAFKFGQYDNTWTNNSYIRCYEGIRQASILINNIDINEELSEVEIADYKAQARFLRSYFYWLLLRKYGPVPLIPEETISIDEDYMDMSYPRSSYDEVVNYISEEMALAARSLPEKRDRQNVNRSTKGAALHFASGSRCVTCCRISGREITAPVWWRGCVPWHRCSRAASSIRAATTISGLRTICRCGRFS